MMMYSITITTMASVPKTIKVGLESIYKNQGTITLSGNQNMEIGYFNELGFTSLGVLESATLNIKTATKCYYDMGLVFGDYNSALEAAKLYNGAAVVAYTASDYFGLYSLESTLGVGEVPSANLVEVYDTDNELLLVTTKKSELVFSSFDVNTGLYLIKVGSTNRYRGAIGIAGTTGLTPYNILFTEEYLYGVVPKEMSSSFPIEALKAQAVAARTIAAYQYNKYISSGYNVIDTVMVQAYGGYNSEKDITTAAVEMTDGEVIRYNGVLAEALYFSTSGGITEAAKDVWGYETPYLQSVIDTYETEPAMPAWTAMTSIEEIGTALSRKGIHIGTPTSIGITERSASGRVKELTIYGTVGSHAIKGTEVRSFFSGTSVGSLKSTYFSFYGPVSSTGSTNGGMNSSMVTVLSASGKAQVSTNELVAVSSSGMSSLPSEAVVLSASGKGTISNNHSAGTNTNLGLETVTGNFTIYGAGYGHGVGMSQSGAKGMAKAGYTYDEILKHYYSGVTVSR